MAEALDRIIRTFSANLEAAGIPLAEADLEAMVAGGYFKPILAFTESMGDLDGELSPDYLSGSVPPRQNATLAGTAAPSPLDPRPSSPHREAATSNPALRLGIREASRLLQRRELSPVDLAESALEEIAERDDFINAFQLILRDEVLAAAKHAEREIGAGELRGPLQGIPVAVKDILDYAGVPTTAGSRILAGKIAAKDAEAVARLKAAGALIVGKTGMSEFAYSPGSNNDHYGPTRNPLAPTLDSGGSSSGSAAATADGMVFAALGTDTGGSIRIPASFCGLVGLKPSHGLLSLQGARSLAWSLDHLGPLARSVADAAILLDSLVEDRSDPRKTDRREPLSRYEAAAAAGDEGIAGLRVGYLAADPSGRPLASDGALAAWKRGLSALEAAGAHLVELDLGELAQLRAVNGTILAIEAAATHLAWFRERLADYGDFARLRLLAGLAYGPTDFVRAQQNRAELRRSCLAWFDKVDLISTPTTPGEAPPLGTPARITFTSPFNLLGWPCLSLPVTEGGTSYGMQLIAPPNDEANLLRAARSAEIELSL